MPRIEWLRQHSLPKRDWAFEPIADQEPWFLGNPTLKFANHFFVRVRYGSNHLSFHYSTSSIGLLGLNKSLVNCGSYFPSFYQSIGSPCNVSSTPKTWCLKSDCVRMEMLWGWGCWDTESWELVAWCIHKAPVQRRGWCYGTFTW